MVPAATLAAVALAVGVIVTVPRGLSSDSERTRPSPTPTRLATPVVAPAEFNPLVPYAAFGWLPAGYSEASVPLIVSNTEGWTARFCDDCMVKWWGFEQRDGDPELFPD